MRHASRTSLGIPPVVQSVIPTVVASSPTYPKGRVTTNITMIFTCFQRFTPSIGRYPILLSLLGIHLRHILAAGRQA